MFEYGHLQFQEVHAFNVKGLPVPRRQNDNRQSHRGFRGGHYDHEQNENLAVQLVHGLAESYKGQVRGVEHQLDGHKNGDDVALENKCQHAQAEQNGA
jgi:hypothetical protein